MIISLHKIAYYKRMMDEIRASIINKNFKDLKKKYLKIQLPEEEILKKS